MQDQSQWDIYQEDHEIEQIWYSSRKISDNMQVRDKFGSWIDVSCTAYCHWDYRDDPPAENQQSTNVSVTTYWNYDYRETDTTIRIPVAWTYMITWYIYWWSSSWTMKSEIHSNGKVIFTVNTQSVVNKTEIYTIVKLWKYDLLTFWWEVINWPSGSWYWWTSYFDLHIVKL